MQDSGFPFVLRLGRQVTAAFCDLCQFEKSLPSSRH